MLVSRPRSGIGGRRGECGQHVRTECTSDDTRTETSAAKSPRRQAQVLKGMRDFLPERMIARQRVIALLRDVFERHGFEPIDTPALEYYDALAGKYGEDEKLIYHFEDHGGREIGLRYDLTVPLARFVAMHRNELTFPFKRYHIGPVWRAERPQKGRYREFWQCDADIVGTRSMLADADVVSIVIEALPGRQHAELRRPHQSPQAAGELRDLCRRPRRSGLARSTARSTSWTRSGSRGSSRNWWRRRRNDGCRTNR